MEWPARSPDLTVPDIFLWGYLKNKVYANQSQNLQQLQARIAAEIGDLDREIISVACKSVPNRLSACIVSEGAQFEHFC